jgi:hypothetical protein
MGIGFSQQIISDMYKRKKALKAMGADMRE